MSGIRTTTAGIERPPVTNPRRGTNEELSDFMEDRIRAVEHYARAQPWSFGLWMLGIGFVLGWKIKPW